MIHQAEAGKFGSAIRVLRMLARLEVRLDWTIVHCTALGKLWNHGAVTRTILASLVHLPVVREVAKCVLRVAIAQVWTRLLALLVPLADINLVQVPLPLTLV